MATKKKMLQAAAGNAGGAGLDVEEVFSTYLYEGNNSSNTITTGVDLEGEGGLLWIKARGATVGHMLFDTERGANNALISNSTNDEITGVPYNQTFTSDGFTLNNTYTNLNDINVDYVSWTFRKAPKFFDVVTYTGTGSAQTIAHDLGSDVGFLVVKGVNDEGGGLAGSWKAQHISTGATNALELNGTRGATDVSTAFWNDTAPTSTHFTVGTNGETNGSGQTYVAYLFAHNDGDGEFGPDGDADIIKCGSYTGNGSSSGQEINLGFEPQWLLIKNVSDPRDWILVDTMRGMNNNTAVLLANTNQAEWPVNNYLIQDAIGATPTGFYLGNSDGAINANNDTYIYIAIRRGTKVPESGDEVFAVDYNATAQSSMTTGFPVDTLLQYSDPTNGGEWAIFDRLRGVSTTASELHNKELQTHNTNAEGARGKATYNWGSEGIGATEWGSGFVAYAFKRAPNFFDVVAYTGNGTAGRTVSHNLGVAPEMMWVKSRSLAGEDWWVYHSGLNVDSDNAPETDVLFLNSASAAIDNATWYDTAPTDSVFYLDSNSAVNGPSFTYIAYLFASLDGVSKVGSYVGTGNDLDIDCGFTSGARFVLIKNTNQPEHWMLFDTARGITTGTSDPYLMLSLDYSEGTSTAIDIDPLASGFRVAGDGPHVNGVGDTHIFYAIA